MDVLEIQVALIFRLLPQLLLSSTICSLSIRGFKCPRTGMTTIEPPRAIQRAI